MRMGTALFMVVAATSTAMADGSRDLHIARNVATGPAAFDPSALCVRPVPAPTATDKELDGLAARALPMKAPVRADLAQSPPSLPGISTAPSALPDLAPSRPSLPDLAPPAQPSQGVPDLAPPAERMLPGIASQGERMLPPLTNSGQSFRMIAVDTNASAFVSGR